MDSGKYFINSMEALIGTADRNYDVAFKQNVVNMLGNHFRHHKKKKHTLNILIPTPSINQRCKTKTVINNTKTENFAIRVSCEFR